MTCSVHKVGCCLFRIQFIGIDWNSKTGELREDDNYDDFESPPSSWDQDDAMSDNGHDFGNSYIMDEPGSLLRKPRQVSFFPSVHPFYIYFSFRKQCSIESTA
jgi:hypothetical protein